MVLDIKGFFKKNFRTQRFYSTKYLNDEFNHMENSFNLLYPKSLIQFAKSKALKIHNKNQPRTNVNSQSYKTSSPHHRFITLSIFFSSNSIINKLNKDDIKTAFLPSKTIHDLVHSSRQPRIVSERHLCLLYPL